MTLVKLPLREIKASIQEAAASGRQRGYAEGYAEAKRMLSFAAKLNGHGPAVLKAMEGVPPDRMSVVGPDDYDDSDRPTTEEEATSDQDVILLAALDALLEAKTHGADDSPVFAYLLGLLHGDEEDDDVERKAFDSSKHPRGDDGRFIGREQIHAAKSDPELAQKLRDKTTDPDERKKLDAALG